LPQAAVRFRRTLFTDLIECAHVLAVEQRGLFIEVGGHKRADIKGYVALPRKGPELVGIVAIELAEDGRQRAIGEAGAFAGVGKA